MLVCVGFGGEVPGPAGVAAVRPQLADIGRRGLLPAVTLGEGQIVFEHVLHLIDVIAQRGNLGAIAQQC